MRNQQKWWVLHKTDEHIILQNKQAERRCITHAKRMSGKVATAAQYNAVLVLNTTSTRCQEGLVLATLR